MGRADGRIALDAPRLKLESCLANIVDKLHRRPGIAVVLVSPMHECHQRWRKRPALGGEMVLVANRPVLVWHPLHHTLVDERSQASSQQISSYAKIHLYPRESTDTPKQVTQDQQSPAITDDIERALN